MKCPYAKGFAYDTRAKCSIKSYPYTSCDHTWDGTNNCSRRLQRHYEEMGWYKSTVPLNMVIQAMSARDKRMQGCR
jgi:hypothetical protein